MFLRLQRIDGGHTLINDRIERIDADGLPHPDGDLPLKEAFFNPMKLIESGGIDPLLKGMGTQMHQEMDCKVVDALRNFLFGDPGFGGLDLAAINIMRGRDRGLPDFNSIREALGLDRYTAWSNITSVVEDAALLKDNYDDLDQIDPWVGMLIEDHFSGSLFGETVLRIMEMQFTRLRDGDRFYYENDQSFSAIEKDEIKKTRFYDILMAKYGYRDHAKKCF